VGGVLVDGRIPVYERIHIGDGHPNAHQPIFQVLGHGELIEIARVVVVDRAPRQRTEVTDPAPTRTGGRIHSGDLRQYGSIKVGP